MQADEFKRRFTLEEVNIEYLGRQRTLIADINKADKGCLKIVDFPTILSGIHHAVHALLPNENTRNPPDYNTIMSREIQRFNETLLLYIKQEACKKITVEIIKEDSITTTIKPTRKNKILRIRFKY